MLFQFPLLNDNILFCTVDNLKVMRKKFTLYIETFLSDINVIDVDYSNLNLYQNEPY
jgi:hypothetical protein